MVKFWTERWKLHICKLANLFNLSEMLHRSTVQCNENLTCLLTIVSQLCSVACSPVGPEFRPRQGTDKLAAPEGHPIVRTP